MYQPPAMRFRGISVLTNTPPRGPQSQPGGMQAHRADGAGHRRRRRASWGSIRWRSAASTRRRARRRSARRRAEGDAAVRHQRVRQGGAGQGRRRCSSGTSGRRRAASGTERRCAASAWRVSTLRRRLGRLRRPVRDQARRPALHPVGHRQSRHRVGQRLPSRVGRDPRRAVGESARSPGATRRRICRGPAPAAAARRCTR